MIRRFRIRVILVVIVVVGALQYITELLEIAATARNEIDSFQPFTSNSEHVDDGVTTRKDLGPIFYNVFIPQNSTEQRNNAIRIVKEQMQQRAWSDPNSRLMYILIGANDTAISRQAMK